MDIPALGEENLAKNLVENDKKLIELVWVGEREKSLKTFEKGELNKLRSDFLKKNKKKKNLFTIFYWSKISFNWSKQIEAHLKF